MRRVLLSAAVAVAGMTLAAGPQAVVGNDGSLRVLSDNRVILTGDRVALLGADWKTVLAPTASVPRSEDAGKEVVCSWSSGPAKVVRTVATAPDGAVSICWTVDFSPGIADGKYIELTLTAPKNAWSGLPSAPHRTIAQSRSRIEVRPDGGPLYFDFSGSTGAWKFEDLRQVSWSGHLRLLYFTGYDVRRGTRFTARLTVSPVGSAPATAAVAEGNGDEYARVILPVEEKNAAPVLPAVFRVDTARPLRRSSPLLYGYNNDWHGYEALRAVNPDTVDPAAVRNPVDPSLTAVLAGVPVPFNRTAGTDSQLFLWCEAVGPNRDRHPFPLWFGRRGGTPRYYGLTEHFSWYRRLDPRARFAFVVNLHRTAPEESRALAEFLTGGADTPLGARRIVCGLAEPVTPVIWELGNEMDLGGAKHMELDRYLEVCRAHIAAIRQVCPGAVFAAHALSSPWEPSRAAAWRTWNRGVIDGLGKDLAYIAFHPYYRGLPPNRMLRYLDELRDDIAASPYPGLRIFNSEHAKWPPGYELGAEEWKRNWYQTHALVGVLDTAEWMLLMLNRPEVAAQTYHSFSAGPWGLVYRDAASGKYYTTGMAELFRFFAASGHDNLVVGSRLEGPFTDPQRLPFNFTGTAELSPDGRKLYLLLNNRLPHSERDLELKIDDPAWKPVTMTVLSAPALESVNDLSGRPIGVTSRSLNRTDRLRVPARSLVRITCTRD